MSKIKQKPNLDIIVYQCYNITTELTLNERGKVSRCMLRKHTCSLQEKDMSHFDEKDNLFGPARASMRARLGEFMDVYMDAKIKIAQKLADKIAGENDVEQLMALRAKLNDVMFAEDDITQLDTKIKALLAMLQTNATAFITLRQQWKSSIEDTHGRH